MNVCRSVHVMSLCGLAFLCLSRGAPAETHSTYAALRAARPQGEGAAVTGLTIERDVFRFRFESGIFQFLAPVGQRTIGAVFIGDGSWQLSPSTEREKRHIELVSGEKDAQALSDRFEALVFLFSDGTAEEIRARATPAAADGRPLAVYESYLKRQRKDLKSNLHARLLQDVLAETPPAQGAFFAFVAGKKLPAGLVASDPWGLDWFAESAYLGGETSAFYVVDQLDQGFWYLAHARSRISRPPPLADATHYAIDTTIQKNSGLRGETTIRFEPLRAGLRVLPFRLMAKLRIRSAQISDDDPSAAWSDVPWIQEHEDEDADPAVVLPAATKREQRLRIRLTYEGKEVLRHVGEGNYVVGARTSWYPNFGVFTDLALFDLTYRVPKGNQVVSVGKPVKESVDGLNLVSVWTTEHPIRVAGFNYGKFEKLERADKDTGLTLRVLTNPGTPDVINEINEYLSQARGGIGSGTPIPDGLDSPFATPTLDAGPSAIRVDTKKLAEAALADAVNTARVGSAFFGRLPEGAIAITQQSEWSFGQSWPSLIFLPYVSFLDGTIRRELGMTGSSDFVEEVGLHELAHQWWGHSVGAASYRDQWLEEGLAEFTSALVLQHTRGFGRYDRFWETARKWILAKPPGSQTPNHAAGPISQGWRLSTRRSPAAYAAMVYSKGGYVVHMLRMMMRDYQSPQPDAKFIAMMREFAATYSGRNASTDDFRTVLERHMVPAMNLAQDGTMKWFFDQWVHGTEIPRYRHKLDVSKAPGDVYKISGTVSQEGVSESFLALAHLYLEYDKGELFHFAIAPMKGNMSQPVDVTLKLPKKPRRAVLNARHDVLARD